MEHLNWCYDRPQRIATEGAWEAPAGSDLSRGPSRHSLAELTAEQQVSARVPPASEAIWQSAA
jgi:hypothetical protein